MRHLIQEQPYERLLAGGRFQYVEDEAPSGALESWRLTAAPEGHRLLRVDLDARAARSGDSYLYHLVLNRMGLPQRLVFRFYGGDGRTVDGNVLLELDAIVASRTVDGVRHEDELSTHSLAVPWIFWFPSTAGLGLLAAVARTNRSVSSVTLNPDDGFALEQATVTCDWEYDELLTVMGRPMRTLPVTIRWGRQERRVWVNEHNHAVKMARGNLVAVETRYVNYQADV